MLFQRYSGTDIYQLSWRCHNFDRYISLHRLSDTVWLETKEIGVFVNPLTGTRINHQLGPRKDYDFVCYKKHLSLSEWQSFDSLLARKHFWQMPITDNLFNLDGFYFSLEAHLEHGYHRVSRDTPEGDFKEIGLYLVHLAGYKNEYAPPHQ